MADDFNISPDMINTLVNMLKNTNNQISESDPPPATNDNNIDFNNLENFISSFTSNSNKSENTSSNNTSSIDFETILKIKSIMEAMNTKNDPRSNLLYSLKPYLRETRQSKLDQYANLLKISQVTGLFKNKKEK